MKILNLSEGVLNYTSNVFLVLGTWNAINDINTLIDVGSDYSIIEKLENINTGLGKNKIDQVILTHSHSDHTAILPVLKEVYNPMVYAFNSHLKGIDVLLHDGDYIIIGDRQFEVFHITAHSYDSICLFCEEEGVLFAGDTNFPIRFDSETMYRANQAVLSRLFKKNIQKVYYGHGAPVEYSIKKLSVIHNEPSLNSKSTNL